MKHVLTPEQEALVAEVVPGTLRKQLYSLKLAFPGVAREEIILRATEITLRVLASRADDPDTSIGFSRQTILPLKKIFRNELKKVLCGFSDKAKERHVLLNVRRTTHDILCREPERRGIAV